MNRRNFLGIAAFTAAAAAVPIASAVLMTRRPEFSGELSDKSFHGPVTINSNGCPVTLKDCYFENFGRGTALTITQ
jgi:hypothetical protein